MIECDVKLVFEIEGPFLSRSSSTGGYGVDAVALRDAAGCPLLPGSHVRGRIREALQELWPQAAAPKQADQWIGPEVARDDVQADRGLRRLAWHFSDFTTTDCAQTSVYDDLLTRIKIDDQTGTVQKGALLMVECGVPQGRRATFSGTVTLSADDEAGLHEALRWLRIAAHWVPSLGAFRNVGFGRVRHVDGQLSAIRSFAASADIRKLALSGIGVPASLTVKTPPPLAPAPPARPDLRWLRITLEEPFCTGGKRRDRNVVGSLRHLPGSVLKGAIAHQLQRILKVDHRHDLTDCGQNSSWQLLCEAFSQLRFCTAFPSRQGATSRPLAAPVSLFKGLGDQVRDAALIDGPFLVVNDKKQTAPAFAPDWKTDDTPGWNAGLADPDVELRIRTAIDSPTRRVRQEHLFAQELVWPRQTHYDQAGQVRQVDPLEWLGTVSVAGTDLSGHDRSRLWNRLEALCESAVFRIGKTKARARFQIQDLTPDPNRASSTAPHGSPSHGSQWIVVLQSAALLIDPREVHDQWQQGIDATESLYRDYFDAQSGGTLELVRHFADQQWHGGFLAHRGNRANYKPFLATEPGSVFVLQARSPSANEADRAEADKKASQKITAWLTHGLPLPAWAQQEYGASFETNPFLPTDGFGEIAVNVPLQTGLAPQKDETCPI